jgi:CO/xanthine dehydrogenase FAD-binding subunit
MRYHKPKNISEVTKLLNTFKDSAQIIAGGTDILVEARYHQQNLKEHWIDISRIAELKQIKDTNGQISIGPAVTHSDVVFSDLIKKHAPLLAEACRVIGSLQIRNRGTIGGNICNASPCADSIPALIVLDAQMVIVSANGERIAPATDFFIKPYQTILNPGSWLKEIRFQKMKPEVVYSFLKLGRRNALAISRMNFAVMMKITNNTIDSIRLAPGSVYPTWKRVIEAEEFLKGKLVSKEIFNEAGRIVADSMIKTSGRRWSTPYKEPVVAALTARALGKAAGLDIE